MQQAETRPLMSVIVPTTRGWPAVGSAVGAIAPQLAGMETELLVIDGSGGEEAPQGQRSAALRWVRGLEGASVFQLRALGYLEARGEIVAITEDHCRPRPDWVAAILRAHEEHPDAEVIGGAMQNGTTDHLIDWAAFFLTQGPFTAPLGPEDRPPGAANLSFKRSSLAALVGPDGSGTHGGFGTLELEDLQRLRASGRKILVDDRILVEHDQCTGLRHTAAMEYHNGRTLAGLRHRRMGPADWVRGAAVSVLPLYRSARALRRGLRKGTYRRELIASFPLLVWLEYCAGVGQLVGYAAGPGDSPHHLL